jgi:hypothetical protein
MKFSPTLFLRLYKLSLRLYPQAFRERYAEQLIDAARLQQAESTNDLALTVSLACDTLRSALREHLRAASPARPGYVAAFALFFSVLLLAVAVLNQQLLRRRADRGPTFVAEIVSSSMRDAQSEAIRAHIAAQILTDHKLELSSPRFLNSALLFTVVYDASGHALGGNATLHGALPQPPQGIFDVIRSRGEDKVTWQPQPGIRVALYGRPMPNGGFVVSGQSLIPGEARTARFYTFLRWMWAFAMLACCALILFTRRPTRTPIT